MSSNTSKIPRLIDVARLAEVSPALVSRILNNDPTLRARPDTRERVRSAVDMLGYIPDSTARALRNAQTGLLGFALHEVNSPIFADMVRAAQLEAAQRGFSIILISVQDLINGSNNFKSIIQSHRVDGLLIQSGFGKGEEILRNIARSIPSVIFGDDPAPGLKTLRLDDAGAARIATEHLLQLGHESIIFVGAEGTSSSRRHDGYLAAMTSAAKAPRRAIHAGWDPDEVHDTAVELLPSWSDVTGIVAATTTIALGIHSALTASNVRIPHDMSLIGIHDALYLRHLNPPLTTVRLPMHQAGRVGTSMLIDEISANTEGEVVLHDEEPTVINRGSTSRPIS